MNAVWSAVRFLVGSFTFGLMFGWGFYTAHRMAQAFEAAAETSQKEGGAKHG